MAQNLEENVKMRGKANIFAKKLSIFEKTEANFLKNWGFSQKTQCVGGIVHIVPPVQVFKKTPDLIAL